MTRSSEKFRSQACFRSRRIYVVAWHFIVLLGWARSLSLVCVGARGFVPMLLILCWHQKDFDREAYGNLPLWDKEVDPWL